jgi:hypothetical protein
MDLLDAISDRLELKIATIDMVGAEMASVIQLTFQPEAVWRRSFGFRMPSIVSI